MTVITNLLFIPLANNPGNLSLLYVVIGADNLTAGLAAAAFIAYLSSLTNLSFTAMQYAMFSSMMTLFPKLLGGYSGSIVDSLGYESFFLISSMMGVPVQIAPRRLHIHRLRLKTQIAPRRLHIHRLRLKT